MPPKRSYPSCHKCGKGTEGKYKDEIGNPICSKCDTSGQPHVLRSCTSCGNGHRDTKGNGLCHRCRYKEERVLTVRICPDCGGKIHSKLEGMTKCMKCIGKPEYCKIRRGTSTL